MSAKSSRGRGRIESKERSKERSKRSKPVRDISPAVEAVEDAVVEVVAEMLNVVDTVAAPPAAGMAVVEPDSSLDGVYTAEQLEFSYVKLGYNNADRLYTTKTGDQHLLTGNVVVVRLLLAHAICRTIYSSVARVYIFSSARKMCVQGVLSTKDKVSAERPKPIKLSGVAKIFSASGQTPVAILVPDEKTIAYLEHSVSPALHAFAKATGKQVVREIAIKKQRKDQKALEVGHSLTKRGVATMNYTEYNGERQVRVKIVAKPDRSIPPFKTRMFDGEENVCIFLLRGVPFYFLSILVGTNCLVCAVLLRPF